MRLLSLKVNGFKSFADPVELAVAPGMTGVVGPNGCGKSNLLEALRWVMGETSSKRIRGDSMDDIIFGGTAERPARNICEVSLTLDMSDEADPSLSEQGVVEIVRRIERGQGTSYTINGKPARLRDVQTLFRDEGSGAGSAAMVSQGRVSALISAKPSERRSVLEEAAGVSGLHARRHEAELRLRATEQNLLRAEDAAAAMVPQLQSLKKQARQAIRFRNIDQLIRQAQALAYLARSREASTRLSAVKAEHDANEALVASAIIAVQQADRNRLTAAAAVEPLRQARMAAESDLARAVARREGHEETLKRITQQLGDARRRAEQAASDLERERTLSSEAKSSAERLLEEAETLRGDMAGDADAVAEAGRRLSEASQAAAKCDAEAQTVIEAAAAAAAKRAEAFRRAETATARVRQFQERLAGASAAEKRATEASAKSESEIPLRRQDAERAKSAAETALALLRSAEAAVASAKQAEDACRESLAAAKTELAAAQAEARSLTASETKATSDSVIRRVEVDVGYEDALAAALGDDLAAGTDKADSAHWSGEWSSVPAAPDGTEPLSSHVRGVPELSARLAAVGVALDRADASAKAQDLVPGQRIVTRDGGLWRWDGYRSLSGRTAEAAGLRRAARSRELSELLPKLSEAAVQAEGDLAQAVAVLADARKTEMDARKAARDGEAADGAAQKALAATVQTHETAEREAAALLRRREEADSDLASASAELAELQRDLSLQPAADSDGGVEAAKALRDAARESESKARDNLTQVRSASEARNQRLLIVERESATWAARAADADKRVEEIGTRLASTLEEAQKLADAPDEAARILSEASEAAADARSRSEKAALDLQQAEAAREESEAVLRATEASLGSLKEQRARLLAEMHAAQETTETLKKDVVEKLGAELDDLFALAGVDAFDQVPEAKTCDDRVSKLQKEKESLGAVNLLAEQSARELEAKLDEAAKERDELRRAVGRLRSTISEINKEARMRMDAAFEKVDRHFREVFTRLFGGGHAYLKLTGAEDPLECGLEIYASPPGKRLQSLSLLSGGEQALTALSLIFAAFLTSPSPVCVLDEVDAPLDDANVDRLCALMEDLSRGDFTRFLVITHHAMTMARMDRLYGVTMAERGVSVLATVNLGQAVELAEA